MYLWVWQWVVFIPILAGMYKYDTVWHIDIYTVQGNAYIIILVGFVSRASARSALKTRSNISVIKGKIKQSPST